MSKKSEENKQDKEEPKLIVRPKTTSSLNAVNLQREKDSGEKDN